jgi:predicted ATPase
MEKIKHNDIKFIFKNIGAIEYAEVPLNDLTMIVGKNSTSKTYLTYIIWGFLDFIRKNPFLYNQLFRKFNSLVLDAEKQVKRKILLSDILNELNSIKTEIVKLYKEIAITRILAVEEDSIVIKNFSMELNLVNPILNCSLFPVVVFNVDDTTVEIDSDASSFYVSITTTNNQADDRLYDTVARRVFTSLIEYLLTQILPKPFIITSERTGISIFYKELDTRRSGLLEALTDVDNKHIGKDIDTIIKNVSRYPLPVSRNMDFVRNISDKAKNKSLIDGNIKKYLVQTITKGKYSFDKETNQIFYTIGRGKSAIKLPIYIASSSIKSLFILDAFVSYIAQSGQILIIDEPELNLHPDNLRHMARLLAMLVNNGVKLLFTTHSDYIIKELNNLIMFESLPTDAKEYAIKQIKKETKSEYQPEMFLAKDKITCVIAKQDEKIGRVKTEIAPINEFGIDVDVIDREINYIGETSDILSELINVNHQSIGE